MEIIQGVTLKSQKLLRNSLSHLNQLCDTITERCVGSQGNRQATDWFQRELEKHDWQTEIQNFNAMDWQENEVSLIMDKKRFDVYASPYSLGCEVNAELVEVSTLEMLTRVDVRDKVLMLHGELTKEQLMPKNFVFYNPEHHQKIIQLLEQSGARAIICATGRNAALAGGVYPFPLIEDGDFDIPSVYMTEEEGRRLLEYSGQKIFLKSGSERIPGDGCNVIGKRGSLSGHRIVITAHIDAKKGTPGAIDNGTGVVILLLLADLLSDYSGPNLIEIVALNGEDYYAVPGQMEYIRQNQGQFGNILLNINIDGAGYREGKSAFSLFNLPDKPKRIVTEIINNAPNIVEGVQWAQGDHSIFIQYDCPAIAVSSKWFIDNIAIQDITHTPKDHPGIVDHTRTVEIAEALNEFIRKL